MYREFCGLCKRLIIEITECLHGCLIQVVEVVGHGCSDRWSVM